LNTVFFEDEKVIVPKVICVGRNYVEHIKELNNQMPERMVIFLKPNSAVTNKLKYISSTCRYEGELCYLIKNNQIKGIGFGLDLTKKDEQEEAKAKGLPWERAKAFDNSAVFSKFIKFEGDLSKLSFKLFINDKLVQEANYDLMLFKPNDILKEINSFLTLQDNDIIMSGTPKGVGYYKKGDIFKALIFYNDNLILKSEFIAK
jgi:2-keto-4-pentenoate hydratase/2-oxohepta-3-ene-1,7-dioic acid hydratase in catechol pathway